MTKLTRRLRLAARLAPVSLFLAGPAAAKEAAPDPATASAAASPSPTIPARPALWKVSDHDTTIWLFGTVHVLPGGLDWYKGPVKTALEGSGTLVTEIVEPTNAEMATLVMKRAARTDGQMLRATLDPQLAERYTAAMKGLGLPEAAFDPLDTWFAAMTMSVLPIVRAGYDPKSGADAQIIAYATQRKIPHEALETADQQFAMFDSLTPDAQKAYLGEVIDQIPEVTKQFDAMVVAWREGNADELARILNEDETMPQLREVLLDQRNAEWAKWIKARLDKPGSVFVAVGAGHLAGNESVQDQLSALGVQSQRVQ